MVAVVDNLATGTPEPLYQLQIDANSRKQPGAAATVVLSPFTAPVHFVLAGRDLDKNVTDTGATVAQEIVKRVNGAYGPALGCN